MAASLAHPSKPFTGDDLHRIDVFLNGGRDYVQGTQMIARAAEILPGGSVETAVLTTAAFKKITRNKILCLRGDAAPPEGLALIGDAGFKRDGETLTLRFAELVEPAERRDLPENVAYEPLGALNPDLCGDFAFAGLDSFEDLLVLIVQTVKAVHEAAGPDVHDIWFTGCRNAALPLAGPPMTAGKLTVRHLRLLGRAPLFQTMSAIDVEGTGGDTLTAIVTFAFQAPAFELEG